MLKRQLVLVGIDHATDVQEVRIARGSTACCSVRRCAASCGGRRCRFSWFPLSLGLTHGRTSI